jgi:hypothetical protein
MRLVICAALIAVTLVGQTRISISGIFDMPIDGLFAIVNGKLVQIRIDTATLTIDASGVVPVLKVKPAPPSADDNLAAIVVKPSSELTVYTLPSDPAGYVGVVLNGLHLALGEDYTIVGRTVTFLPLSRPCRLSGCAVKPDILQFVYAPRTH